MDESGGRGRPRSGNDESAERHAGPAARAAEPTPTDEQPTDERPFTPEQPTPAPEPPGPATPADTPVTPSDAARDDSAADGPAPGDETPAEPAANRLPQGDTHPDRADAETPHTAPADAAVSQPAPAGGDRDGGDAPQGDTHPDRADAETPHTAPADAAVSQPAPARGDREGGDAPDGDTHPDRAYASGPHSAPVSGRPEADRLHKAHAPAPGSGDQNRPQQPSAPAPGTGHPNHPQGDRHLAHSADGKGPAPQRPEPRGGLLMGRPFGVPVYVAPSWFLVAALITWVFGGQLERVLPELGAARYLVSLFFAVAFYASVLVHELAHTVAALRFKLPVRRIQLQFFGGVSEIEKEAETPGREFVLAFVGPLLSLVLAGVFYAAAQTVEPGTVPGVLLAGLMISNLIVAAFNLLPGLPLDGGRMLRAVVWKITGKPMKGTIAAAWVGRALAISVLIGLPLLTQSGALGTDAVDNVGMDTVLDALLAAILAAIIWTGAGNSLRMARLREHLPELRARALTRRAVPVESDTPLSEALRRANTAGARALVVVDPDGKPLSLVREAAIVGVPEHRRPWVAVSGLAQDLTDGMRVSAELSGEELLDALRATPATEYLVVEETGEIYGVLSAADVERAFVKAMARPS
ncbi:Zn-dependent protease (includes SpoIVFB) [Streptomyces sp. Ag82_O1-12]|uniref:site-2 protease family protein n=1 Tax=unclassified Streptomyces TaxID=2593676 RepID=UPI000BDC63C6|nr:MULTISPECIES: site-2 protease family protein [unclassified Streptomyces]SMQ15173.1 Zn-dependent protease (includes SpoIVFB) [Streptomyces sp. Ag82_O1-12]SOD44201.1 Zn-dependent protease (includes SpoIVFB) [Streptomyces sp. Ag82_G6-1]